MKSTIILCCAAIWLVLSGCRSTLKIGVDVYNGPLVNNQEIQMQQLIGVVHGAYPLLAKLNDNLSNKSARRDHLESERLIVREILDMYKPKGRLELLVSRLSQCMNNIDNADKDLRETSKTLAEFFSKPVADEPVILQAKKHITAEMNEKLKQYNDTRSDFYSSSDRELCGDNDDSDDVKNNRRMVDLAYVKKKREEIENLNKWIANPSNDTLPEMPNSKNPENGEKYTTLKQWASYYAEFIFKEPWKRKMPFAYAYQKAVLDCYGKDQANTIRETMSAVLERLLDANTRIYYWYNEYKEARQDIDTFVSRAARAGSDNVAMANKDKEEDARRRGFRDAASVAETREIIAKLPTPASLASHEPLKWGAANMKLKNTMEQVLYLSETTPLQHGRLQDGLWALMDKYIATEAPEHRVRGRRELLLELARFGEKLRMVGTYDTIVDTNGCKAIKDYRLLLNAIGNYVVFVADVLVKADAARMRKVVEIYEAAKALSEVHHKNANNGEEYNFLKEQVERLKPWVEEIREGKVPEKLLAMETVYEDAASLRRKMVQHRKELLDAIGNDEKAGKFKKALEELIGQRSDVADLTSARDFLRTIVVKGDEDTLKTSDKDTLEAIDAHIWQEVNKVKVSSMSNSTYVVVKDYMGNWNVRSMTADPKDMLAAAFGSGKAVAEILMSGSTGGVSDAFRKYLENRLTEPETGAGSEIVKKQLEEAWHAYEHAVATQYESAFSEAKKDASEMLKGTELDPSFNEDGKSSKEKLYELCNLLDKFKGEALSEDVKQKIGDAVTATKEKLKKALAGQKLFLRKYFEDLDAVGSGFETEAAKEP